MPCPLYKEIAMKKVSLTVDAGGTKLHALVFDKTLQVLRQAKTQGVNVNISTANEVRANIAQCLDELFPAEEKIHVLCVYYTFIGPFEVFRELLEARCLVERYQPVNEGVAGMLAGIQSPQGFCAMAGTGSDVYYAFKEEGFVDTPGLEHVICPPAVGGWGAVIGDSGSGAWMGQKAMQLVAQMIEGMIPSTPILQEVEAQLQAYNKQQMIREIYRAPAPFRMLAQLTPAIARAARAGDQHALDIFRKAGEELAMQVKCQMERHCVAPCTMPVVCAGGAWKAHEEMFQSFERALSQLCPGQQAIKPRYEQVCAGMVLHALENGKSREEICAKMDESCAQFIIPW